MAQVKDYFDVQYGTGLELSNLELDDNGINFVSRTEKNNGISARVKIIDSIKPLPKNTITVAGSGNSVMESSFQNEPYYTGFHVFCLIPKVNLTLNEIFFYCMCLKSNRFRFNYGRQANKTLSSLIIPDIKKIPKWVNKIKIPRSPSNRKILNTNLKISTHKFKWFQYDDIFEIKRGESLYVRYSESGIIPYISASSANNGVLYFVSNSNYKGNKITLSYDGAIGEAFYQPKPFFASEKIAVIDLKNYKLNKYIAFFLITLIRKEQYRFNYGLKWSIESRMKKTKIKLPVKKDGSPDWKFMEDYIKSLPYSKNI